MFVFALLLLLLQVGFMIAAATSAVHAFSCVSSAASHYALLLLLLLLLQVGFMIALFMTAAVTSAVRSTELMADPEQVNVVGDAVANADRCAFEL